MKIVIFSVIAVFIIGIFQIVIFKSRKKKHTCTCSAEKPETACGDGECCDAVRRKV
ncbi:hypothetical protein [Flexistipes sinusarabici]|uniref:hypothetical protein n=1 Tax=Flexistipes sinusarabici TaxID=2352 RepID=UPI002351F943|nr:hypothetical protein [Flexistipes sinusarabici]